MYIRSYRDYLKVAVNAILWYNIQYMAIYVYGKCVTGLLVFNFQNICKLLYFLYLGTYCTILPEQKS